MPALGAAIRGEWALDSDWLTVNHGSYGATPKSVLAAQQDWRRQMEGQPTRFFSRIFPGAVREAAAALGAFVGAKGEDIAFVTNATEGCNAVLRSLALRAGARMTEVALPFPDPDEARVLAALDAVLTARTRLAVLDHVTSASALVLP